MTATWPGMMNPSILFSPRSNSASMAGGHTLWQLYTEKFSGHPFCSGTQVDGAVVSNPTPTNTSGLSGASAAIRTASSIEYTMRTSAPSAFAENSDPAVVGTLIMSPNAVTVTPALASAIASAISLLVVTHTGQPGPCAILTPTSASMSSRPNLTIVSWCVPQMCIRRTSTSIARMWSRIFLAVASSLYLKPIGPPRPCT